MWYSLFHVCFLTWKRQMVNLLWYQVLHYHLKRQWDETLLPDMGKHGEQMIFICCYQKKNTVIGQSLFFSFSDQIKPVFPIRLKIKTEAKDAKDRHLEILTGSSYWGWCSRNSTKSFYSDPEQKGKVIICSSNIFLPHASRNMLAKHTAWKV